MRLLYAARVLRNGGLIAHHTGTLPGIAALPTNRRAVEKLCRFKQRRGPFLLLAASMRSATRSGSRIPAGLKRAMRRGWPGPLSFILPAAPGSGRLAPACFSGHTLAVRVDSDPACRFLAGLCDGLLISSSLNRRGGEVHPPSRRLRMRWHRHLALCLPTDNHDANGSASSLLTWRGGRLHALRGKLP